MRVNERTSEPQIDSTPSGDGSSVGGSLKSSAHIDSTPSGDGSSVGGSIKGSGHEPQEPTADGVDSAPPHDGRIFGESSPLARGRQPGDVTVAEGRASAHASVIHEEGSFGTPGGPVSGRGSVEVLGVSASAQGRVAVNASQGQIYAQGRAEARATVVRAEGELHSNLGGVGEAHLQGDAFVGARAQAEGALVVDPSKGTVSAGVKGDAFAGASVNAQGSIDVGGVGATGGAHAYAGAGVKFEANAGFDNGKLHVGFDVGAAVGVGWGFKVDVSLDIPKLASGGLDFVPGAKQAFGMLGGLLGGGGGGGILGGLGGLFGGGGGGGIFGGLFGGGGGPDKAGSGRAPGPADTFNPLFDQNPLIGRDGDDLEKSRRKERPPSLEEARARDRLQREWSGSQEERIVFDPIGGKGETEIG